MQAIDAEHADELLEAYKEHNDGLHETLEAFDELLALLPRLKAEGRKLGHRHGEAPSHRRARARALPGARERVRRRRRARGHRAAQAGSRARARSRSRGSRRTPAEAVYVGDSPFDIGAAKAAGVFAVAVGWGGIHSGRAAARGGAGRVRPHAARSSSVSSRATVLPSCDRAAELRRLIEHHNYRYHVLDDPELADARTTCSSTSCRRSRTSIPSSSRPTRRRSASARRRRRASARSSTSRRWGRSRR